MIAGLWAEVVAGGVVAVASALGVALWRRWSRPQRRELRRVYRDASRTVDDDEVRAALVRVLGDADVRSRVEADGPPAEEWDLVHTRLRSGAPRLAPERVGASLEQFYRRVQRGLAAAQAPELRQRAEEWRGWQPRPAPAPAPAPAPPPAPPPPAELSRGAAEDRALLGRDGDLADLSALLAEEHVRLVTLVGPGGVGKTELARAAADGWAAEVQWVDLRPVEPGEWHRVAPVIARALRAQPADEDADEDGTRDRLWLDAVVGAVGDRALLLVLDNVEHVIRAAPVVAQLLDRCPALTVLATSRRPLRLRQHEHEFPVRPLAVPPDDADLDPARLLEWPAVRLFVERARRRLPDFALTAGNGAAVARVCRRLDGLPYLLRLAAPMLKYYGGSVPALLSALESAEAGPDALPDDLDDPSAPHRTALAVTTWSYRLLTPARQAVFRQIGVFVGEFDDEAARAVCDGPVSGDLWALVDDSLLQADSARYRLLESARECALHLLEESAEADAARDRHARYFHRRAAAAAELVEAGDGEEALDAVRAAQDDVRAAFRRLLEHDAVAALDMGRALGVLLAARGRLVEAQDALADALARGADAPVRDRLRALDAAAHVAVRLADWRRATRYGEDVLALSRDAGTRLDTAEALHRLGRSLYFRGRYDAARHALSESAETLRELGRPDRVASVVFDLGAVALDEDDLDGARARFEECLALWPATATDDRGRTHVHLAFVQHRLGRPDAARRHLARAERLLRGEGYYYYWYLHFLGRIELAEGDVDAARGHFEASARVFQERDERLGVVRSLLGLAAVAAAAGGWYRALVLLSREEALRGELALPFPRDWAREARDAEAAAVRHLSGPDAESARADGAAVTWEHALTP